jgi:hypothetical protein
MQQVEQDDEDRRRQRSARCHAADEYQEAKPDEAEPRAELERDGRLEPASCEQRPQAGEDGREQDDEDRIDRLEDGCRNIPPEQRPIDPLVGEDVQRRAGLFDSAQNSGLSAMRNIAANTRSISTGGSV